MDKHSSVYWLFAYMELFVGTILRYSPCGHTFWPAWDMDPHMQNIKLGLNSDVYWETNVPDSAEMAYIHHIHFCRLFPFYFKSLLTCSQLNLIDGARCRYKICDMTGKLLYKHFTQTGWDINTSHLPNAGQFWLLC